MSPSGAILRGGPFEPGQEEDPEFVYQIELLSGAEGEALEARQMSALRDFLIWARAQRSADEDTDGRSNGTPE